LEQLACRRLKGEITPAFAKKAKRQGDDHWLFERLPRRSRHDLSAFKQVTLAHRVEAAMDRDFRGAGLAIQAQKLAEVPAAGFCEASDELLDSGSLAVVAREIQIHAGAKFFRADQGAHHAHQLRTF